MNEEAAGRTKEQNGGHSKGDGGEVGENPKATGIGGREEKDDGHKEGGNNIKKKKKKGKRSKKSAKERIAMRAKGEKKK